MNPLNDQTVHLFERRSIMMSFVIGLALFSLTSVAMGGCIAVAFV